MSNKKKTLVEMTVKSKTGDGCHLQEDDTFEVIGPLGPQEGFIFIPTGANKWEHAPWLGKKTGTIGKDFPLWEFKNVLVDAPSHTPAAQHNFVIEIEVMEFGGVEEANQCWIAADNHPSATGGDHGGGAHAER